MIVERRINFHLDSDEEGYPPTESEGLWARPLGNGNYVIDNIPFYVKGISSDDEVSIDELEGELQFRNLVNPSGTSTFRLFLSDPSECEEIRKHLKTLGCETEFNQVVGVLAVGIPGSISIEPFLSYILDAQEAGRLDIEEGALRHEINS